MANDSPMSITMEPTPNGPVFVYRDEVTGQTRPISEDEANRILGSAKYYQPKPSPMAGLVKPAAALATKWGADQLMGDSAAAAAPSLLPFASSAATVPTATTAAEAPSILPFAGSAAAIPTATIGAETPMFAMPGTILGSETLGAALPIASIAAGGYGLYNTFAKPQDRQSSAMQAALSGAGIGAGVGSFIPVVGTGLGALVGGGVGGLAGMAFGKDMPHPETTDRRTAIEVLRQAGIVDKNRDIQLEGGNALHIGDPQKRSSYNIDLSKADPSSVLGQTVGGVGPLAALIAASQNGQSFNTPDLMKRASDMAGLLANGAMASKNPLEAAGQLYKSFGLNRDQAYQGVAKLAEMGAIDPKTRDAWFAATDRMFNVRNPNAPAEDQARFDQFQRDQGRVPGQAINFDGPSKLDLSSFFKIAPAAQAPTPVGVRPTPAIPDAVVPTLMGQQAPRMSSKFAGPGSNISAALGASMPQTPAQAPAQAPTASYFPSAPTNREELGNMIAALSMSRTGPEAMRYFVGGKK